MNHLSEVQLMNNKHSYILEGLQVVRNEEQINESIKKSVTSATAKFFKEHKTKPQIKDKINNILNYIYKKANEYAENMFVGGSFDYTKGDMVDNGGPESGPMPELNPSIYEVSFEIRFTDPKTDIKGFYYELSKGLQSEMKSNYKDYEQDAFSIDMCIDGTFDDMFGYSVSIEKTSRCVKVTVINQTNPFTNESKENPTAEDGIEDVPYIQKRKDIEKEKEKKEESGSDANKNDDDDSNEDGVFGTEIGLPIDKENCESTDVSGVSTPTGTLNPKKKNPDIVEGIDSDDTKDMTIECPECGSQLVNVRDADIFHCSDCGYEWEVQYDEEEKERLQRDTMLDNSQDEDPQPDNAYSGGIDNMYTNPQNYYSRTYEGVSSASDLRNDLMKAIANSGEIEYLGPDYVEVRFIENPIKSMENILKKKYKVKKANNRLSVDGGDPFHYIEIQVKPKVGNKGVYVVDYDIPG